MTMANGSGWQWGQVYRVRAVQGQVQIKRTPNKGTPLVEVMCEITAGPKVGSRVPWTGWLNSDVNVQSSIKELRALGWKGAKLGDWSGLFSKECQGTVYKDDRIDEGGTVREYPRLSFLKPIRVLSTENVVPQIDIDNLNEKFGMSALIEAMVHDDEIPF